MRLRFVAMTMVVLLAQAACGTGTHKRMLTRPDSYAKLISFPSTGDRFDIRALERDFPELKGIVITAPEYLEEYARRFEEAKAKNEPVFHFKTPPGANIRIEVVGEPDLTRDFVVPPDGYIQYPHLGDIFIQNKSRKDIKEEIETRLKQYLRKPEVLVHILSSPQQLALLPFGQTSITQNIGGDIILMGRSGTSGFGGQNLQYTGRETLLSVVGGGVGGVDDFDWRQIRIIRRSPEDPLRKSRVIICDLWEYYAKADVRQDVPIFPGDVIFLPPKWTHAQQFAKDWGLLFQWLGAPFTAETMRENYTKTFLK